MGLQDGPGDAILLVQCTTLSLGKRVPDTKKVPPASDIIRGFSCIFT